MDKSIYTILILFLHQFCEFNCSVAPVSDPVLTAQEGDSVSMPCLILSDQIHRVLWYRQFLGEKPVLIVSSYHHSQPNEYSPDFENSHRIHAVHKAESFNLTIIRSSKSDSAMYFCGTAFSNSVSFITGTVLLVKDANLNPGVIHQPVVGVIKPGNNVTLQCSVQAKMCDKGVQLVYWFTHSSHTVRPGMIYTHEDVKNECGKSIVSSSGTRRCLFNLPKMNVGLSDAGIYYCAVVTCGQVLFGNGTTLDIEDGFNMENVQYLVLIGIIVLCTVSLTVNIILCLSMRRKGPANQQIQTTNDITTVQYTADVNYAALNFSTKRGQRKTTVEETTYAKPMLKPHSI